MSSILIVDSQSVYRSGLRALIETRLVQSKVVDWHCIDDEVLQNDFDLILVDVECIDVRTTWLLHSARRTNPKTHIVMMSSSRAPADAISALAAGFHGFLYKLHSDDDLVEAINDLLSGRIHVPLWIADDSNEAEKGLRSVNKQIEQLHLTPRQRDILSLIEKGLENKEIARQLEIAEGTVKVHTAAILRILGARNRTEAAFFASRLLGYQGPSQPHSQQR